MLVEDDDHIREAMTDALEAHGFGILSCMDCAAAVEALKAGARPDLILLDLLTPRMTGWEFRVEQRKHPAWSSIPVVALTACTTAEAAAIDADAHLTKPVDLTVLLDTIQELLDERDHQRLDARLRERDRLSSLGALASSIAHEVNNPLSAVVGNLDLAQRQLLKLAAQHGQAPDVAQQLIAIQAMLTRAESGSQRVAEIVRRMAQFARPPSTQRERVNVAELVESSLQFVENELRHRAYVERVFETVPDVEASPARLGQVFLNLLMQALFGLDEQEAGEPKVGVTVGEQAGVVVVAVSHTAGRRAAQVAQALFEPATAREPIASVAESLDVSRRCVEELGGSLTAECGGDGMLTLRVRIPGCPSGAVHADAPGSRESTPAPVAVMPGGRVLVIDDEPMVCELIRALLETRHEVTTLGSGQEALALLRSGASFDAIVCDVMMPGQTGIDVYERLLRERPDQAERILFVSGGTFTERARTFFEDPGRRYLLKPFETDDLQRIVAARIALSQGQFRRARAS